MSQQLVLEPIRNLFFDLGGVLFNLNTRLSLHRFAALGIDVPAEILSDTAPFNASPDGPAICRLIHRVDLGEVQGDEFLSILHSQCRPGVTEVQVLAAYNDVVDVPLHSLQLLSALRRRYRLYAVSNIGDLHWERVCQLSEDQGYGLNDLFDQCFLSYQMHLAKPDPAFFHQAILQSGVIPSQTLYIDDSARNVEAGRSAGLQVQHIKPFDLSSLNLQM